MKAAGCPLRERRAMSVRSGARNVSPSRAAGSGAGAAARGDPGGGCGRAVSGPHRAEPPEALLASRRPATLLDATLVRGRVASRREDRIWIVCGAEHADGGAQGVGPAGFRVLVEPQRAATRRWPSPGRRTPARRRRPGRGAWRCWPPITTCPDASGLRSRHPAGRARRRSAARARDSRRRRPYAARRRGTATSRSASRWRLPAAARGAALRREARSRYRAAVSAQRGTTAGTPGIFVWSAATLLSEIERWAPEICTARWPRSAASKGAASRQPARHAARRASGASWRPPTAARPSLPIDVAVMERSDRVWTLPVDFAWSDVGTWSSLADALGVGDPGARAGRGRREPGRSAGRFCWTTPATTWSGRATTGWSHSCWV